MAVPWYTLGMKSRLIIMTALFLLAVLPLAGGVVRGLPEGFFSFPPLIVQKPLHAPFSVPVFVAIAAFCIFMAMLYLFPRRFGFALPRRPPRACPVGESVQKPPPLPPTRKFPLHGKLGLALLAISWVVAWGRFGLPPAIASHTFFPLWLGFVFTMDGLVFRRSGHSLFADRRGTFLLLFPVSALSWWYFELLNRLVRNWWYSIPMPFGPAHYLIYSSLCFSTVLPAIFEVHAWLASFPVLRLRHVRGPQVRWPGAAGSFAVGGAVLLPLIPLFPDPLFFLVWLAPLALLAGALALAGVATPFSGIRRGDWSAVLLLALAALICGFFWETWNFHSSPRWAYSVPYVDCFHLFEMPAVGYAGYLPFGPVCACFWIAWTALLPAKRRPVL